MTEAYAVWRATLAGAPMQSMEAQAGFWRVRAGRGGPWVGVAIWPDNDGTLRFMRGKAMVEEDRVWPHCGRYPVTEDAYRQWFDTGAWPDDAPAIAPAPQTIGSNQPPEPIDQIRAELAGETETAAEFMREPVTAQEQADKLATWAKRLGDLAKRADELRETEKAPHLAACREIDGKWKPIVAGAKELGTKLKRHAEPFLLEQKRKADEAARAAAEEARKLLEEAAAVDQRSASERADLEARARAAEAAAKPKNATAGRTGAKIAVRTIQEAVIVDYPACYAALAEHPDMRAFVQTLADRACRAKVPLAGVEFREIQKVA